VFKYEGPRKVDPDLAKVRAQEIQQTQEARLQSIRDKLSKKQPNLQIEIQKPKAVPTYVFEFSEKLQNFFVIFPLDS
jgi:hypothetical protein